jgi:dienelactone hydrolase
MVFGLTPEELFMAARRLRRAIPLFLLALIATVASASTAERVVDLTATDGTKLKGTYFSAGKPGPGVLLLHQCNRQRKVWDSLSQQLAARGINVFTFDYRGFGESGGVPEAKLTGAEIGAQRAKWTGDIDVAYQYLVSQNGVNKEMIGVGGASCGVDNSVQTAIRHPEVKSLVLLSGPTDRKGREFLRNSTVAPEFFAAADDDEFPGTVVTMEWYYNITGNSGKTWVHETTGGHGADMFKAHPELMKQITDWYVTTLLKTPGHAPASKVAFTPSPEVIALSLMDQPGGPAKVSAMVDEARQKDPKANLFDEATVNLIGYELIQSGDNQGALEIMKLNEKAYPNSPNVYDSLADAYVALGQKEQARQASQKALELLASDTAETQQRRDAIKASAEARLKQLGDAQQ